MTSNCDVVVDHINTPNKESAAILWPNMSYVALHKKWQHQEAPKTHTMAPRTGRLHPFISRRRTEEAFANRRHLCHGTGAARRAGSPPPPPSCPLLCHTKSVTKALFNFVICSMQYSTLRQGAKIEQVFSHLAKNCEERELNTAITEIVVFSHLTKKLWIGKREWIGKRYTWNTFEGLWTRDHKR
jgi:hypothetical protein